MKINLLLFFINWEIILNLEGFINVIENSGYVENNFTINHFQTKYNFNNLPKFLYLFATNFTSTYQTTDYVSIKAKVNGTLFYSIDFSKKSAIIIPSKKFNSSSNINLYYQCKYDCNFKLNYVFTPQIDILTNDSFWFNTLKDIEYEFNIYENDDESDQLVCIKTTYSKISQIDKFNIQTIYGNENQIKRIDLEKNKIICYLSNFTINYTIKVNFTVDDYVYIYSNTNTQKIYQSGYAPINFRYIDNNFLKEFIIKNYDENLYVCDSESDSDCDSDSECQEKYYIKEYYNSLIISPSDPNALRNFLFDFYINEGLTYIEPINNNYYNKLFLDNIGDFPIKFTTESKGLISFQFIQINDDKNDIFHRLYFEQILKDRLIKNEIRFYRQGEFNNEYKKYFYKIEKIKGNIRVYTDICMNNSMCYYSNETLYTYKLNKKANFTELFDISNTFLYFIDVNDTNKTSLLNPLLMIIECIDDVCIYNISIEYLSENTFKKLFLEKPYIMYDKNNSENLYEINLDIGLYSFYIYEIFGKLKVNFEEANYFENFTYLNYKNKIINVTNNDYTIKFNIILLEDTVYYLCINKLNSTLSRIILPNINNLLYIKDINNYTLSILESYHEKNVKIFFKELIGNININLPNHDPIKKTYNNLYIFSLNNYENEKYNFNLKCLNEKKCLISVIIQDNNNNIISSPFFYNYFILDKNISNLKINFPVTNSSSNYYFNYFYVDEEEELTIYQSFSVNGENLTIDDEYFHNNFTIKKFYSEKYSDSNCYYFYIEIFLNTTYDEKVQYIVEINMKTDKQYPTLLFPNEIFYDYYGNLSKLFFILNVEENDKGNLYYNIEKGCGSINGTIKTIDFKTNNINDNLNFDNNLTFDKYSQKLSFTEESTEECINLENEFCFLFINIENDLSYINNLNKSFTIMIHLNNEEIYIKPEINIIANLYKDIDIEHLYKFYYSKNYNNFIFIFSSNEGNILIKGKDGNQTENSQLTQASKFIKFREISENDFLIIKIYSNFQLNNYVYYKLEISSKKSTIPITCNNIYKENYNLLNFYDNQPYLNKITCFSNCQYCKIEDYDQYNNLKCINCALKHVSILYDNENINQTHCLDYCTINYFEYFNRTCEKIEKYLDYALEFNDTYTGFNFSSIVYEYDNYTFNYSSSIDLKDCESIIKKKYKIEEDSLIIYLVTVDMLPHQVTNQLEYMVFIPNGTKVDLNICKDSNIIVSSYVNLSRTDVDIEQMYYLASKKFDIFNSSDPFYTDICVHFTAKNSSLDVTLEDRRKFYVGVKFCEENCSYAGFDVETHYVKCSCPVKTKSTIDEKVFKENTIDEKFNVTYDASNFKYLKCIKAIDLYIFIYNIGLYFGLANVILVINYAYKFYKLGFDVLPKLIQNFKLIKQFNKQYDFRISRFNKNIKKKNKNHNINENISSNRNFMNNPPKKTIDEEEEENNENSFNIKKIKNSEKDSSNISEENNSKINEKIKKYYEFNKNKTFKYSNDELNEMNFDDSIKNDNRKFSEIYFSFLKYSQLILFTFFNHSDYNLNLLKKQLFFFTLLNHLIFNIIFFNDNDVAYVYEHKKNFLSHFFSKIIYTFLICGLITFVLKFLCLTGRIVKILANLKNEEKFKENIKIYKIIIIIKTILFQIICVIFTIFSWYYITIFFVIYRYIQIVILELFLISFLLTMSYPFILCLIGSILRIFSLSHELKIIFYISKIFQ